MRPTPTGPSPHRPKGRPLGRGTRYPILRPKSPIRSVQRPLHEKALPPSLFISHKKKDAPVAKCLLKLLDENTDRVGYFISEHIEKGTDWRKEIAKRLTRSSFLVLLFTDPEEDWGWCLYETGFFDALLRVPGQMRRRIVCLHHHKQTPPNPIANLQSVRATAEDVSTWLQQLFGQTRQKKAFLDKIPELSSKICALFGSTRHEIYAAKRLFLTVTNKKSLSEQSLPADTEVSGEPSVIEEVFQKNNATVKWEILRDWPLGNPNTKDANLSFLREISRSIYCYSKGISVPPLQGVVFVGQGPKRYRPVFLRVSDFDVSQLEAEMLLVEDVGGQLQNVDRTLAALLTAIRLAIRIRWEIIKPFFGKTAALAKFDAEKLRFDLQTCLNNVFQEAEFRGLYSERDIYESFEKPEDKQWIEKIAEDFKPVYRSIWKSIGFPDTDHTFGKISAAPFSPSDMRALQAGLKELREMNQEFLRKGLSRVQQLVDAELAQRPGGRKR
jgi:TIR domain